MNLYEALNELEKQKKVEEKLCEDKETGRDLAEYQKWVDYDMKKYGKISEETQRKVKDAGLEIIKDQYGDYEVIAKEDDGIDESCATNESCSKKQVGEKLNEASLPYGVLALNLAKIIRCMSNEDAYLRSTYLFPDDCHTAKQACQDFPDRESYKEWEDGFKRIYKDYHKDGLYIKQADQKIADMAHEWDKKLGLEPIEIIYADKKLEESRFNWVESHPWEYFEDASVREVDSNHNEITYNCYTFDEDSVLEDLWTQYIEDSDNFLNRYIKTAAKSYFEHQIKERDDIVRRNS